MREELRTYIIVFFLTSMCGGSCTIYVQVRQREVLAAMSFFFGRGVGLVWFGLVRSGHSLFSRLSLFSSFSSSYQLPSSTFSSQFSSMLILLPFLPAYSPFPREHYPPFSFPFPLLFCLLFCLLFFSILVMSILLRILIFLFPNIAPCRTTIIMFFFFFVCFLSISFYPSFLLFHEVDLDLKCSLDLLIFLCVMTILISILLRIMVVFMWVLLWMFSFLDIILRFLFILVVRKP
ncbi:hypothetical protein F4810DRAFT_37810 [Camillea tinctor]|nr:hypothetical protein F4810DRAFT_37810 [Camillea tinctor]